MEVGGARLLRLTFLLCDEKNDLVALYGRIDRGQRSRPAHEERDYYVWEDDNVAERKDGDAITRLHTLTVAQIVLRHDM